MEDFINAIGRLFVVLGIYFLLSLFIGFLVWLLWPVVIPAVFPGLVQLGYISSQLNIWESILCVFLFGILFKGSKSS